MKPLTKAPEIAVAGCLLLLVLGIYFPVRQFSFVSLDDYDYVSRNDRPPGLTMEGVRWAFTSTESANWFPLTRLSFLADRQFWGPRENVPAQFLNAEPFHWTNAMLHAANTLLLFGLLVRLTGELWPSTLVAFLFALHPQHVESVAWVAERKDVLSTLFWMLALWSYAAYAKRPKATTYLLTVLLYGLGFLAKPMVITLPVVLLLLDIWPLRRFPSEKAWKLVFEKTPFFVMAPAMAAVTVIVQRAGGAVRTLDEVSLGFRVQNALIAGATYALKTIWPSRLAVFYPLPPSEPMWQAIAAALALASLTVLACLSIRTHPYLTVGWFWYAIALLPVIGIVQVGNQMRADRYTYIPTIGLAIMLAWSGAEFCRHRPWARPVTVALGGIACVVYAGLTWRQISYWENSQTLWQHALAVTVNNGYAHANLGNTWAQQGLYDDAIAEYRKSLAIAPHNPQVQDFLGRVLYLQGRTAEALAAEMEAVTETPDDAVFHNHLGMILQTSGRASEAVTQFESAIRLKPDFWEAEIRLGNALQSLGRTDEANRHFAIAFPHSDSAGKDR